MGIFAVLVGEYPRICGSFGLGKAWQLINSAKKITKVVIVVL